MSNYLWASLCLLVAILLTPAIRAQESDLRSSSKVHPNLLRIESKSQATEADVADRQAKGGAAEDAVRLSNAGTKLALEGSYAEALEKIRQAIQLDSNVASFYLNLSVVYDHMHQTADALSAARQALLLDPGNASARIQVCELELVSKQYDESLACYEEMRRTGPLEGDSLRNYGLVLLWTGRLDDAESTLQSVLQGMPGDPGLLNGIGMLRYEQKRYEEAAAAFKQAVEINPTLSQVRFNLAMAQIAMKNKAGALSQYHFLEESSPKLAEELSRLLFADKVIFVGKTLKSN